MIEPFKIENESEADDYLRDLLAKNEYRSMSEVKFRAIKFIEDENLRKYFIRNAQAILDASK